MLAEQGKLRLRVIEPLLDPLQRHLLPSAGVVAGLAGRGKAPFVRIGVAIGTGAEWNACVSRLVIGSRGVALRTLHAHMKSS